MAKKSRWRVSAAQFNPRDLYTEHAIEAARLYVEEQECPRFTVLTVDLIGSPHERRRFKVLDGGKLEVMTPTPSDKELR